MTTRAEQKEKRRFEILSSALDLFIRRGYAATRITDIARAAGMSTGLMFHYYESKEQLYLELVKLGVNSPNAMVNELKGLEPLEFFTACAKSTLKFAAESEFTAKMFVLMNSAYYSEGTPQEARAIATDINFYSSLAPVIELGQSRGSIRAGDPVALCTTFWCALQGTIQTYALNPSHPLPDAEWIVDIIRAKDPTTEEK